MSQGSEMINFLFFFGDRAGTAQGLLKWSEHKCRLPLIV